jgi:hypothetical protein
MATVKELVVDEAKIKKAVQSGIPLTITTFTLPHEIEVYIEEVLTVFLRQVDQEKLKDYIVYCVQELAVNAKKPIPSGFTSLNGAWIWQILMITRKEWPVSKKIP